MAVAGKVATVPRGEWSADTTYEKLDLVTYSNQLFMARKTTLGNRPTLGVTDEFWMFWVDSSGSIATPENAGKVKPDGKTIEVDKDGVISTGADLLGLGKVDNTADAEKNVKSARRVVDAVSSKELAFSVLSDGTLRVTIQE